MKIKSLILGSAAALVAVSGARAADAIMMEPEPVEYVRVCDAYGAGFFYIPGTETCLKIGGFVFYEIGASSGDGLLVPGGDSPGWPGLGFDAAANDQWRKFIRARVNFDARSETEWGTLRSFVELESNMVNSAPSADSAVALNQAYIQLGGLLMGYTESAMFLTPQAALSNGAGFGWYVSTYSYSQRQLIQYNFSGGGGFFATLSLENDVEAADPNYIPDVVVKAGIQQAWGAAYAQVGIDEFSATTGDTEYTVKAGLHLNNPSAPGSAFRLVGWYASGDNVYNTAGMFNAATGAGFYSAEWSVYAGYQHAFSPQLRAFVGAQYYSDLFLGTVAGTGLDAYHVEAGVIWTPVTNFEIRSDIYYTKADTFDGTLAGFLRFTRYF
jgi:hypothetical protein